MHKLVVKAYKDEIEKLSGRKPQDFIHFTSKDLKDISDAAARQREHLLSREALQEMFPLPAPGFTGLRAYKSVGAPKAGPPKKSA